MPTYGAHAFVWVGAWTTQTGNHAIAEAGKAGFDFIEIPLLKPDEFDPQPHKQALDDAGIYATASLGCRGPAYADRAAEGQRFSVSRAEDKLQASAGATSPGASVIHSAR